MTTDLRKTKRITLGTMCFALFMVMLDSSVVNLALPTIQRKLGAGMTELQWIVDAYILLLASLLLTGGTLGDLFGRRRAFMGGLAAFTCASFACALAPSTGWLIAARGAQGVGAAVMMPSTLSILTNTFTDPRERARAIGTWGSISGLALAIGPLIGGVMVEHLGWQSVFLINVPVGITALVLALRFVPESADPEGRSLDLPGQVLAIVGLGTLTYALIEANTYGWGSTRIVGCFVAAAVALAVFLLVEARSVSPMLELRFFRNGTFAGANLVAFTMSFGFFGMLFFLGLYYQCVLGYSPTKAGVFSLPSTLGVSVMAFVSGRIAGRVGSRVPMVAGLTMMGIAMLLLTGLEPTTPFHSFWYWLLLMGAGSGLTMSPMTAAVMSTVPPARAGMASSTSNTMRQMGSVFGIALLGNLLTHRFADQLAAALRALHLPAAVSARIMASAAKGSESGAASAASGVHDAAVGRAVGLAFTSGFHLALWIAGIVLLTAAPLALVTIRGTSPRHRRARAPQATEAVGEPALDEAR